MKQQEGHAHIVYTTVAEREEKTKTSATNKSELLEKLPQLLNSIIDHCTRSEKLEYYKKHITKNVRKDVIVTFFDELKELLVLQEEELDNTDGTVLTKKK